MLCPWIAIKLYKVAYKRRVRRECTTVKQGYTDWLWGS